MSGRARGAIPTASRIGTSGTSPPPPHLDPAALRGRIAEVLGTDAIDLVDLTRASGLLRYLAARDGQLVFEARAGLADDFWFEAARFWCDAAPVLQRGYEETLAELTLGP